jgi:nucleoside recognition membrane protein YjiH
LYEHRSQAVLPRDKFLRRASWHLVAGAGVVAVSLVIGTVGYHTLARLEWVDALLNATMILTGMGPVSAMGNTPAKLFSALYAMYSGIVFVAVAGILLAPFLHRMLHRLHVDV